MTAATTTLSRRISGVPSGSGRAGSATRLVTRTPAIAATAPSGHHATPRMANAPMTKKTPSQASVGQAVRLPRRAMSTTTAIADPKNSIPGTSWSEVACHSVMRSVTKRFVVRPRA